MPFDFDAAVSAPFRMQPGLRRLATGDRQLTLVAPGSRHQREKLAVLSAFAPQAMVQRTGFDAMPAVAHLAAHAASEHPGSWAWNGRRAEARHLGVAVEADEIIETKSGSFGLGDEIGRCLRVVPAGWRLAGLLSLAFAEDFAILDAADGSIPWLAVALPSHWAPEDKVGRHFSEIHAPVADNALLIQGAQALTRLVAGPQVWERFVWNVTGHSRLHAHPQRVAAERWEPAAANDIAANAWWRTEHQTFIPIPRLRQAIFTISVDLHPLAKAIDSAHKAHRLAAALESMSPAVLEYRSLGMVREALLQWLARRQTAC